MGFLRLCCRGSNRDGYLLVGVVMDEIDATEAWSHSFIEMLFLFGGSSFVWVLLFFGGLMLVLDKLNEIGRRK